MLTGLAQVISSNAWPGETMTATLNGFRRSFVDFVIKGLRGDLEGYGCDGAFYFSLPSLVPGTYACPDVKITYSNQHAGPLEFNRASTQDCCTLEITRSGGLGEFIEGTFSGILIQGALGSWIKVENGHFAVKARSWGAGGAGGGPSR